MVETRSQKAGASFSESGLYRVYITRHGSEVLAGSVTRKPKGWQFIPSFQALPSRKLWPTADEAVRGRLKDYRLEEVHVVGSSGPVDLVVTR